MRNIHIFLHQYRLSDLEKFIGEAERMFSAPAPSEPKGISTVRNYIQEVNDRQPTSTSLFDPIKDYIAILNSYDYELPAAVHRQMEELPPKWNNVKKLAIQMKQKLPSEVTSMKAKTK